MGDNRILTRTKCGYYHGYMKLERKIQHMMLTDTSGILVTKKPI